MLKGEESMLAFSIFLSSLPIVISGFFEDLKKNINIYLRFLSAIISGIIFILITGYNIDKLGIYGLDYILSYTFLGMFLRVCQFVE